MIWYRYVDDIFTYWDDRWGNFEDFFIRLNSLVPSIKFKCEWERDGSLPFLDVHVIRCNNKYAFKVYRKPTFSISYIHFLSYHEDRIKIGLACNLFLRALRICSPEFCNEEFNTIRQQLTKLLYPRFIIEKAICKARGIYFGGNIKHENNVHDPKDKIVIPYSKEVKIASETLGKNSPIIFSYPSTIGSALVNVYQNKNDVTAGVYRIPCKDCDKWYYGQTGRSLQARKKEHMDSVRKAQNNSAIFQHMSTNNHRIGWDQSELIYKSTCEYKRKIIEAALIKQMDNYNISEGQWKTDLVDAILIKTDLERITSKIRGRPPELDNNMV